MLLLLAATSARAEPPAGGAWFVPPPPAAGSIEGQHTDMHQVGTSEEVTVTAKRRPIQRNPHGEETKDYQPAHSDAAAPEPALPTQTYCQSAYATVGGQAATGQDLDGSAAGRCE